MEPGERRRSGMRVAIRDEGEWIVAYVAHVDSLDDAFELSRIRLNFVEEDGGSEGDLFQDWKEALKAYLSRALERLGVKVDGMEERQPPPGEKPS
jgi:hypothetical protein